MTPKEIKEVAVRFKTVAPDQTTIGNWLVVLEALRNANELLQQQQWQPIESAPRDGTRILSCRTDFEDRLLIYAIVAYENGEWHLQALMGGSLGVGYYPTHWQPLPQPPKDTK